MLNTSDHDTSGLLKPGEAYSHSFPIVAPESREKYLVFLRFTAFFSPEGVGSEPWFYFSASDHYNIGKGKPGYISPNELPPITVVDKQDKTNKTGRLVVEIEKPYGIIAPTPINITIDKASWIHLADSFPLSLFFKHNFLGIISTNVSLFTVDGTYRPRYLTSRPFKKEEKVSARACFSIQTST